MGILVGIILAGYVSFSVPRVEFARGTIVPVMWYVKRAGSEIRGLGSTRNPKHILPFLPFSR